MDQVSDIIWRCVTLVALEVNQVCTDLIAESQFIESSLVSPLVVVVVLCTSLNLVD